MAKTNLIWIMADQLRADMVGCNGDPNVHTPNIDALAAGGANFTRALSTNPLCCPARASMITGCILRIVESTVMSTDLIPQKRQ